MIDPWLSPGHMLQVPAGALVLSGPPPRLTWAMPGMTAEDAAKTIPLRLPGGLTLNVIADPSMPPNEGELRGPRGQVVRLINIAPPHALDEADRP